MTAAAPTGDQEGPTRRNFLYVLTTAMAVGGAAAVAWPLVDQMNPAADVLAAGSPMAVDLSKIELGQQILVLWRSYPIFIVRRTPANLEEIRKPGVLDMLADPDSNARQQPSYAQNWSRSIKPEFLVLIGICTHLGCTPSYEPVLGEVNATWPGGWLCPCHGSKYDLAGRVFKLVPAPLNLPVPPYFFESPTSIVIGKNPPGESFEVSEIEAL